MRRRPREDDADERARQSNKRAAALGLVPPEGPLANWNNEEGIPVEPRWPDYRANPRPEPEVERLPFANLKGG